MLPRLADPDWDSSNVADLQAFFATPTGKKMWERLLFERPIFANSDAHPQKSFARSRDIAGYEQCLETLHELAFPVVAAQQKPSAEMYPPLDDESQWPQELDEHGNPTFSRI